MKNVFAYSFNEFQNLVIDFENTAVIELVGANDISNDFVYEENNNVVHVVCDDEDGRWISQEKLDMIFDDFINSKMNNAKMNNGKMDNAKMNNGKMDNAKMNYGQDEFVGYNGVVALNYEDALKLAKFINKVMNDSKINNIFIHCSAGQSRSQAIVRYINDVYGDVNNRKDNPCMTPNMWIVMMLKRVYRNFI